MAHVIGITGLAGAGKDTCALAMQSAFAQLGARAALEGYADPIRRIAYSVGLNPYDRKDKERAVTFRNDHFCDLLQAALDHHLGSRLQAAEIADLYSNTINALPLKYGTHLSVSPREFMQILGTEGGQAVRRTLWVELAAERWDRLPGYVLVSDFRFMHEVPPLDRIVVVSRKGVERVNAHVSEDLAERLTLERPHYLDSKLVHCLNNHKSLRRFEKRAAGYAKFLHKCRVAG